ncbi:MAG: MATE family efflux transporter [Bacillota bacterium]
MEHGSYVREIRLRVLKLAWPAMLEMSLHMALSAVDTAMVARLGAGPLAATALAAQVYWTIAMLAGALNAGTTALVSAAFGAKDWPRVYMLCAEALLAAIFAGAACWMAVLAAHGFLPLVLAIEADVLALWSQYLTTLAWGSIPFLLWIVGNAALRSTGDTMSPLAVAGISNAFNAVADWCLIFGNMGLPMLGVRGAALASVLSMCLGGTLTLVNLLRRGILPWPGEQEKLTISRNEMLKLVSLSLPASLETLLLDGARSVQLIIMSSLPKVEFAAHQIAATCESVSYMPGYGLTIAGAVLVGQSLGAGEWKKARDSGLQALLIAAATMGGIGLAFVLFPGALVSFFAAEPEVLSGAARVLRIAGLFQPFVAATDTLGGALRGAGNTKSPLKVTAVAAWAFRVPLTFLAVRVAGLSLAAIWWINCLDWVLRAGFMWRLFQSEVWSDCARTLDGR